MKKKSSEPSNSTNKVKKKEGEIPSAVQTTSSANKLAEQRELLRGILDDKELLELAVDGILIGSHDGIIIGANSYMQQLTGRTLDKLIGAHISTLFNTEELTKNPLRFDLLHKGEVVLSERNIVRPDGKIVPIEMHTKMMPNGTYQSIYRDITERKTAEKALKESEEKYRKTFYISPDAVNIIRLEDGMRVSINSHFTKVMGYTESDIIGKTTRELDILVNPEDRKRLVEGLKKDGIVENLEAQFRKKNGEIVLGSMSASLLELDGVPHIISITRDITERKQTEEALCKSESKLRAIFAAMTDVIMVVDAEGRYLEIAPSNPSLLYKPSNELLGKTMHEVFPKEQADFFLAHVTQSLNTQQPVGMEYTLEIENKKIWFSALLSPLTSDSVLLVARDVTEQKKAEEKLKESDQTYRGIINCIDEAIYVQDKDGTFLDVNDGAVKMYGYTREELIGKNPLFVSAEGKNDIQKVAEQVKLAFEGIPQEFEFWGKRKNGQIFPKIVRVYKGLYFGKDVCIAVAQDVTEKKQVVQTLKASEELFRNLVENISDVFYISDANGRIKYCSPNFFTTTGFSYEEIINNHFVRVCAPVDRRRVVDHYAKEIQKGVLDTNLEFRIRRKDGTIVWIEQNTRIIRDEKENIIEHRNIAHDIDDRKKAEAAIRKSEEWFRNLFEKASDGIFHSSLSGKIVSVNKSFAMMHGYTVEEMQKINIKNLDTPECSQLYPERIRRILAGENLTFEVEHYHKNGHTFPLEVSASMITVGNEKFIIAFHRDITARKKAEEKIKKLNRLYTVLSNVNQAIVRIKDREQLFNETCRVVVDDGKFVMVWIGMVNPSTNKVDVVGSSGVIKDYLDKINIDLNDKDRSGGIVGQAIKKQTHIIANDIKNDNSISQWKEDIIKNDFNSAAAFPLTINGKVVGSFALYASEVNFFDEDEIKLLDELTMDISFALEVNQHEAERKQAEEELRKKEDQMRLLVEGTPYLFFYTQNINAEITYISPSVEKITGHPVEEWYNQTHWFVTNNKINEIAKEKTHAHLLGEFINSSILLEVKHADNHPILLEIFENPIILNGKVVGLQGVAHNITEQKFIEQKLKESEELFRNLVENITDVFYTVDGQGIMKYCSPNFFTLTGFLPQEILGHHYVRIIAPIDRRQVVEHYSNEIKRGVLDTNLEVRVERKDGKIHWIEQNTRIVRDEKGNVFEFRNVARDITQRKNAEEALRNSEERFRLISNLTSDYIFSTKITTDGKSEHDWVMGAFEKITGYTIEEYKSIGGWQAVLHPDDREKDFLDFQKLLNNEKVISEVRTYHKNGNIVWNRTYASPIWDDKAKKLIGIYGAVQDITEKKYAEELINESEKKFRKIAEGTKAILFNTSVRGKFIYANQAASEVLGYENKDLVGKFYLSFVHPDDRTKVHSYFLSQLKKYERDRSIDFRYLNASGKVGWLSFLVNLLYIDGKLAGFTGVAQEITERKQTEEALRKSELHFRSVWENAASGMRLTNEEGMIIAVNNAFCQIVGKTKEELEGFHLSVIYSSRDSLSIQQKHQERFKTRTVLPLVEKEFILWNDKKVWFRVVNSFIESEYEKPLLLGVFTDITEQKLTEGEIKKLSQAVEQSAGAIVITDLVGNIEYVNKKFEETTGYTFEEVKGQNPRILKSGETPIEEYKKMWECIFAGSEWRGTFHNKRKDGSLYWEATTISPIKNNEGKITNFLAIKEDITQDKLKEEMLKQSELLFSAHI
ncbi:MAG: PAS domain S-box protein [Ignavibacteriaceae bacterium]